MKALFRAMTLSLTALVGAGVTLVAEEGGAPSKERIAALIRDLGAEKADTRDRASKELESIGEHARPALKEAAKSDDPEVAWRARTILDRLDGGGKEDAAPRGKNRSESRLRSFNFRIDPGTSGSSVVITQDGSGRVSVQVTEEQDGKRVTKNYEAESPEAFQSKYPEIAKRYGVGEAGRAPRILRDFMPRPRLFGGFGLDEDFFDQEWPKGFGREMDELQDRIRRQIDELFQRHNLKPWGWRSPRVRREEGEDGPPDRSREEAEEQAEAPAKERPQAGPSSPATLGVRVAEVEPALRSQLRLGKQEGVLVEAVEPGGRAEKAGFQPHDVILAVNGTTVKGVWELRRVLRESVEADTDRILEVEILRAGEKRTVPVRMD